MIRHVIWLVLMAILGLIILSMVGAVISTVNAQTYRGPNGRACDSYYKISGFYEREAGKVPVARGLGSDGKVIEVLANAEGNFTILIIMAGRDKWACAIKHGVGWNELKSYLKEGKGL